MICLFARRRVAPVALATILFAGCAEKNVPENATTQGSPESPKLATRVDSAPRKVDESMVPAPTKPAAMPTTTTTTTTALPVTKSSSPASDTVPPSAAPTVKRSHRDSVALASMTRPDSTLDKKWPVKMPDPLPGAIFPAKRVVAFYGNPLVKKMGVLGEYPKDEMLAKLDKEVARWQKADPSHPVQPALHLIVTVASDNPGKNGLYRTQMFDTLSNMI